MRELKVGDVVVVTDDVRGNPYEMENLIGERLRVSDVGKYGHLRLEGLNGRYIPWAWSSDWIKIAMNEEVM